MTLILALGNSEQVIQVSDRRLTRNGLLVDDESNKAGMIRCCDARFAYGFTGIAQIGNFITKNWLIESIYNCLYPDYCLGKMLERLREKASNDFRTIPIIRRLNQMDKLLTILFSGYLMHTTPPIWGYSIITNDSRYETSDNRICDNFIVRCWKEKRPFIGEPTMIQKVGAWPAITKHDEDELRKFLEQRKPIKAIIGKCVDMFRIISARTTAANTVGKQLSIITIPRDISSEPLTGYESDIIKYEAFFPDQIVAFGDDNRFMARDSMLKSESTLGLNPFVFPRVGRNRPCPCGSKKKYKRCHGKNN